ncbi:ZAP1 [[Candida] subhashii]|uniref:ZAP1 n=1 Tax=[Candida] subhashii TaxID=561895 RepID=A0A8J5QH11_9ASCO|nr:ZAP1 [[Candida] subhashii]KAG7661933.1 ZAP1 [[Candida] subhashii]
MQPVNNYSLFAENGSPRHTDMNAMSSSTDNNKSGGNVDQQVLLTHGYVHGHIHKHKDHTHIHGHIHNHDHDKIQLLPQFTTTTANNNIPDLSCSQLDLSFCDDVLCDELDDCFFLNCDGSEKGASECCDHDDCCIQQHPSQQEASTCDKGRIDEICCTDFHCDADGYKSEECCDDPNCPDFNEIKHDHTIICNDPECSSSKCCNKSTVQQHEKNHLCELQLSKQPIFEDLIGSLTQLQSQNNPQMSSPPSKKQRLDTSGFEIHFPHECHPEDSAESVSSHRFHQSCFHTTIPGSSTQSDEERRMSDFDFVIQFNNFNQLLREGDVGNSNSIGTGPTTDSFNNNVHTPAASASSNNMSLTPTGDHIHNDEFSCQWEKCFKKVNDDTFLNHVLGEHVVQDQLGSTPSKPEYQCEWNDCNFMDTDFKALVDHLNSHKQQASNCSHLNHNHNNNGIPTLCSQPQQQFAITPASTGSIETSPNDFCQHNPMIMQESTSLSSPNVNITSIKIMPKKRPSSRSRNISESPPDPEFKCMWEIGVSPDGTYIPCGKTHQSAGELQEHLIQDHIGSGKSIYNCSWIGCDRHHGKLFNQRQKLLRHIHIHTRYKPFKCSICESCFAVEGMLEQHLRIHSGEKPFKCSICGKQFATSSSLSIHNRVHTGEKPLVCKWPGCGKRFSESSNLTKHMKIHTKCFVCEVCGKEFDKKTSYNRHIKSHST